jgi:TPR repeat protein
VTGDGVEKDESKAGEWWHKASAQGHAAAQCDLGWAYDNGRGVPKDSAKAVELYDPYMSVRYAPSVVDSSRTLCVSHRYLQAAAQGNFFAQNNLGIVFKNGMAVPMDLAQAFDWFMKAAEQVRTALSIASRIRVSSLCSQPVRCRCT